MATIMYMAEQVGWTLVHFLWQGTLIALGYLIITRALHKNQLISKYWVGMAAIVLTLLVPALGLLSRIQQTASIPLIDQPAFLALTALPQTGVAQVSPVTLFIYLIDQAMPYLVSAWLLAVSLISVKLFKSWLDLQKIKAHAVQPLPPALQRFVDKALLRLKLHKKLQARLTDKLSIPAAFGHFKPIVLFPVALINQLPQDQIEAIILHELCHIKRRDFLHNLLQLITETLFFFHPMIKWMNADIRNTREQCCDQMVLSLDTNPMVYARALTNVASLHHQENANFRIQVAFNDGQLLQRIKTLLHNKNKRSGAYYILPLLLLAVYLYSVLALSGNQGQDLGHGALQNTGVSLQRESKSRVQPFYITDPGVFSYNRPTTPVDSVRSAGAASSQTATGAVVANSATSDLSEPLDPKNYIEYDFNRARPELQLMTQVETPRTVGMNFLPDFGSAKTRGNDTPTLNPVLKRYVDPVYPVRLRKMHMESTVFVNFRISDSGRVYDVDIRSQNKLLVFNQAIKDAMRQWLFEPESLTTSNLQRTYQRIFTFQLDGTAEGLCYMPGTGSNIKKPPRCSRTTLQ